MRGKNAIGVESAPTMLYLGSGTNVTNHNWRDRRVRILAVEDEPEYLEMLQMVMSSLGHTVILARNGIEAMQLAEREKVDVILSDVIMPSMDGIELHKQIRSKQEYKETPFIFLTGATNVQRVKEACTTKEDLLLQKPFPVERLLQMFSGKTRLQI
jgi:CheY-like chemotaxis protein